MDYIETFKLILDLHNPDTNRIIQFLNNCQDNTNRNLQDQLEYTLGWCYLSKLLYHNRGLNKGLKTPKTHPLNFTIVFGQQQYTTNNYLYYTIYQVFELTKTLLEDVLIDLNLGIIVKKHGRIIWHGNDKHKLVDEYISYMIQTLGILSYCFYLLNKTCIHFRTLFPTVVEQLNIRRKWIRIVVSWLRATSVLQVNEPDDKDELEAYQLFEHCSNQLYLDELHVLNDQFLRELVINSRIQSFIAQGNYYLNHTINNKDVACYYYNQAMKEGCTTINDIVDNLVNEYITNNNNNNNTNIEMNNNNTKIKIADLPNIILEGQKLDKHYGGLTIRSALLRIDNNDSFKPTTPQRQPSPTEPPTRPPTPNVELVN